MFVCFVLRRRYVKVQLKLVGTSTFGAINSDGSEIAER